jgi:hypothetical protein
LAISNGFVLHSMLTHFVPLLRKCGLMWQAWSKFPQVVPVLLLLTCETVWNKFHTILLLPISTSVIWQFVLYLLKVTQLSGHQFISFCNCGFQTGPHIPLWVF